MSKEDVTLIGRRDGKYNFTISQQIVVNLFSRQHNFTHFVIVCATSDSYTIAVELNPTVKEVQFHQMSTQFLDKNRRAHQQYYCVCVCV